MNDSGQTAPPFLSILLATGFYSGYAPVLSGTCGTAAALIVWLILGAFGAATLLVKVSLALVATGLGVLVSQRSQPFLSQHGRSHDPSTIVIDEWAGIFFALIPVSGTNYLAAAAAFILFRFFDIVKPGPVGWCEKLPGAWGIMMDDVAAGVITALIIYLMLRFQLLPIA